MSADSKSPGHDAAKAGVKRSAEEPYDLIKDASQIIRYIEKALADEENVEININDRTRTYFSYFMDHLPEALPPSVVATETVGAPLVPPLEVPPVYPAYDPCSYLREKKHLLVAPLAPAMGNAMIRSSHDVDVRFFQGVKSLEFTVNFEGTVLVRGEPVIQLSFPKEMRMIRKRRHYRAPYSEMVELTVAIKRSDKAAMHVRLVDISVGGLGFCLPPQEPGNEFVVGGTVKVEIRTPMQEPIQVSAFVRNVGRAGTKDGCPRNDGKVGLQFDLPNETMAMRIEETVAYLQREYLQYVQSKKSTPKAPAPRPQPPAEDKKNLKGELSKLLGIKKGWGFT